MRTATLFANVPTTSAQNSIPYEIGDLFQYSVQVLFDGAAAGSLSLYASNVGGTDLANYVMIPGSTQSIAAGNSHLWNVSGASYRWIICRWVPTSGVGNMNGSVVALEPINRY